MEETYKINLRNCLLQL